MNQVLRRPILVVFMLALVACGDDDTDPSDVGVTDTDTTDTSTPDASDTGEPDTVLLDSSVDSSGDGGDVDADVEDTSSEVPDALADASVDTSPDVLDTSGTTSCETAFRIPLDTRFEVDFSTATNVDVCNTEDETPSLFYTVSVPPGHRVRAYVGGETVIRRGCDACDRAVGRNWVNDGEEPVDVIISTRRLSRGGLTNVFIVARTAAALPNQSCDTAIDLTTTGRVTGVNSFASSGERICDRLGEEHQAFYFVDVPPGRTLDVAIRNSISLSEPAPFYALPTAWLMTGCDDSAMCLSRSPYSEEATSYTNTSSMTERIYIGARERGLPFDLSATLTD